MRRSSYVPQGYPEWKPDIQELNAIAQLDRHECHEFLIESANGQFSGEKHYVNPDTRYAFIAVGRDDAEAVDLKSIETEFGALGLPLFFFVLLAAFGQGRSRTLALSTLTPNSNPPGPTGPLTFASARLRRGSAKEFVHIGVPTR